MGFIEDWNRTIAADSNWQFEAIYEELEEEPELAELFAKATSELAFIETCVINRMARKGIYVMPEEIWACSK